MVSIGWVRIRMFDTPGTGKKKRVFVWDAVEDGGGISPKYLKIH